MVVAPREQGTTGGTGGQVKARRIALCLASCMAAVSLIAQRPLLVRYDMTAQSWMELNPNIRLKKAMGEIGTFSLGEFKAGFISTPHHHTYEQITIGLSGEFTLPVGGVRHTVSALRGVVIPADVEHNNDVPQSQTPTLIEFQSTRRVDFPPEREKVALPVGPVALQVPAGHDVIADFTTTSTGWKTTTEGVRVKASVSSVSAVGVWIVPVGVRQSFELRRHLQGSEQFAYLVEGAGEVSAGTERASMTPGTLVVGVPGSASLRATARGDRQTVWLVFEATR
jgi:quercetin dioxygenase-like cupin family protein